MKTLFDSSSNYIIINYTLMKEIIKKKFKVLLQPKVIATFSKLYFKTTGM